MLGKKNSALDCANEIKSVVAALDPNDPHFGSRLAEAARQLIEVPSFESLGARYQANHTQDAKYLYYDGELSIVTAKVPAGAVIPPHDHGVWEAMVTIHGGLRHTVYERKDDGSKSGYAELSPIDDRVLKRGDLAMVAPPSDIHGFKSEGGDCLFMAIVGGEYKAERTYYNLETKSCIVMTPKERRERPASR